MIVFAVYLLAILVVLTLCAAAADLWLRFIDDPLAEAAEASRTHKRMEGRDHCDGC